MVEPVAKGTLPMNRTPHGRSVRPNLAPLSHRLAVLLTAVLLGALLSIHAGCASGPQRQAVADWHDAVLAVREQSGVVFRGVNELVRESQLRRAERLANLRESDFHPGLDAASVAAWNRALDSLAAYSAALSTLLDPELAGGVGASTRQLGESIAATARSDLLAERPGLASAMGRLAAALVSAAASSSAQSIMREADPAVGEVLDQMASTLIDPSGETETGVGPTLHAAWTLQADEARTEFLSAQSPDEKRAVAARYAELLEKRDASVAAVTDLRRSLLELRAAHQRAALGGAMDTGALVASIREQIAFLRALFADLSPSP